MTVTDLFYAAGWVGGVGGLIAWIVILVENWQRRQKHNR